MSEPGEQTFREDERQACWEDFMNMLTCHINAGSNSAKAVRAKLRDLGWKELGTGDGKPMHRYENSEVNQWLKRRGK